ncbi:MAG: OmpA family protein [Bacteroidetes bacterium]|nr:OmpA family protein [Bacteroidota bacterium]
MSRDLKYLGGDFEGYFYTLQKSPLGSGEVLPGGGVHAAHIYRGKLENARELPDYQASNLLDSNSLLLHNANQIEAHVLDVDRKIFDFDQAVLNDVKIVQSWEMNGKTYGVIKGRLYGKVKGKAATFQSDPTSNIKVQPENQRLNNSRWTNLLDLPSTNRLQETYQRSGCLRTLWDILKWILLLMLLYFLFTRLDGCFGHGKKSTPVPPVPIVDSSCCLLKDSLIQENKKIQDELDSIKRNNGILEDSIKKEQIQQELDELSSKVFFFGNSTKIREYSESQLDQIVELLNKYPNLEVEVRGYYNYSRNLGTKTIDGDRAEVVKQLLIQKGVDPSRIDARGMGPSYIYNPEEYEAIYDAESNTFIKYNRNMRVEVKIIKY